MDIRPRRPPSPTDESFKGFDIDHTGCTARTKKTFAGRALTRNRSKAVAAPEKESRAAMFAVEHRGSLTLVRVRCEVDLVNSGELDATLSDAVTADASVVIVSLGECGYCDSTALAVFIRTRKKVGDRFAIVLPIDSKIRRIFEVTQLLKYLRVYENLNEAMAAVSSSSVLFDDSPLAFRKDSSSFDAASAPHAQN